MSTGKHAQPRYTDYLAALNAAVCIEARSRQEMERASNYGRTKLRDAAADRRAKEQEWQRLAQRATEVERGARSLAHTHGVTVDPAQVSFTITSATDLSRELRRNEADLKAAMQAWEVADQARTAVRSTPVLTSPAPTSPVPAPPAPAPSSEPQGSLPSARPTHSSVVIGAVAGGTVVAILLAILIFM